MVLRVYQIVFCKFESSVSQTASIVTFSVSFCIHFEMFFHMYIHTSMCTVSVYMSICPQRCSVCAVSAWNARCPRQGDCIRADEKKKSKRYCPGAPSLISLYNQAKNKKHLQEQKFVVSLYPFKLLWKSCSVFC